MMMLSKDRHITHMDLDTFFVSVEYLRNPKLIGKPVLVGGMSDRGVVAACSYEARKFGIHSGMPMRAAKKICSHAVIVKNDFEAYTGKNSSSESINCKILAKEVKQKLKVKFFLCVNSF